MSAYGGAHTGLGHRAHPLLGRQVVDAAHADRVGILRAVAPNVEPAAKHVVDRSPTVAAEARSSIETAEVVAWLAPITGGVEWPTALDAISEA